MSGAVKHWWRQRISSIVLVPLTAWLLWIGLQLAGADYATAVSVLSQPMNALMAALFLAVTLYHTQSGITVIVEDYIEGPGMANGLIWFTRIGCTVGALVSFWALFTLTSGS